MFRGYKDEYVFWDSIIMLRKALLALIVGFGYPLGVTLQGAIASFILFVSVQIQLYATPFAKKFSILNHMEAFSLAISATTFSSGVFMNEEKLKHEGRIFVAVFVVFLIIAFTCFTAGYVYVTFIGWCRLDLEEDGIQLEEVELCGIILKKWASHRTTTFFRRFKPTSPRHTRVAT